MVQFALKTSLALVVLSVARQCTAQDSSRTFVFSIDLLQGTSGYYLVDGYDGVQPELTMVRGQTYTFDQTNSSNWYHPLGFAYYPDGAHEGVDELESGVGNGDEPYYIINGELSDLDTYEPEFFYPEDAWMAKNYTVNLTVTSTTVTEIFYFCHIHNFMSGRIYIVDAEGDEPEDPEIDLYEPLVRSDFDVNCGTFDSEDYAPEPGTFDSELCEDRTFLCGDPDDDFDVCMHAIDCKMNYEMRIEKADSTSNVVVFMQQMIPHHENAVNMARVLLKNPGDDANDEVMALLREIINSQNAQITSMRAYLSEIGASEDPELCEDSDNEPDVPGYAIGIMAVLAVFCLALLATICIKYRQPRAKTGGISGAETKGVNIGG